MYLDKGVAPEKINSYATKSERKLAQEEQLRDLWKHKRVPIPGSLKHEVGASCNVLRTIHLPNETAAVAKG